MTTLPHPNPSDPRIHAPADSRPRAGGEFVLYWMQATMRAHDNFALNFAIEQANELNLPVVVYHGLRHDYPWASDRFHTWILESVVDLYADFAAKGIQYAFWLDFAQGEFTDWPAGRRTPPVIPSEARPPVIPSEARDPSNSARTHRDPSVAPLPRDDSRDDWSPLVQLARRAALVVTDFFPTFIQPRQTKGLSGKVETPVIAVESATVVPMAYLSKEFSTARGIRPVLMEALPHFLWPVANPEPVVKRAVQLPFDPVIPSGASLPVIPSGARPLVIPSAARPPVIPSGARPPVIPSAARDPSNSEPTRRDPSVASLPRDDNSIPSLVARCDVDHSVPPSRTFRGGTRAGRARLAEFLATGLRRYADDRNDPNKPEAVSRLSPWLHFGNLSIHEILLAAREAGPAEQYAKFLDEALTWRELAHNFCYWNPKHRTAHAIPGWAREQLRNHESDPRPHLYTLEEMEQARTGEELWNAAQRSYLREGFMHNYMRMLWGKTVLQWTPNAAEALRVLEHLNNKYSLDGRDPNSYGGIMWIFGKFDRPFYKRPIYGMVRYQSLRAAREKFDVGAYCRKYGSAGVRE